MSTTDPYEGTIYRDLTIVDGALDMATILNGDLPPIRIVALSEMIGHIDVAIRALQRAREKAAAEHRTLDDAQLAAIGFRP